jgi:hypothetical protein
MSNAPFPLWTQSTEPFSLSPAGTARRSAIGTQLQRAMRTRRRNRVLARTAVAALVPALAIAAAWWTLRPPTAPTIATAPPAPANPGLIAPSGPALPAPAFTMAGATFTIIHDQPDIIARLAPQPDPASITRIDDDRLLATLAEAGRPSGLIRVGHRVLLEDELRSTGQ